MAPHFGLRGTTRRPPSGWGLAEAGVRKGDPASEVLPVVAPRPGGGPGLVVMCKPAPVGPSSELRYTLNAL